MDESFALSLVDMQKGQAIAELRECNGLTARYGLLLSEPQMHLLVERRFEALKDTGRMEFGQGILKKLIAAFCDSPYISQADYEQSIIDLQDAFYYCKNESMEMITDDELIAFMRSVFNKDAQGSFEQMSFICLERLCRNTRYGYDVDDTEGYGQLF